MAQNATHSTEGTMSEQLRGFCQICERDVAVVSGGLTANHGYQRPGWGQNVGGCPGERALPYEVSCEALKHYAQSVAQQLADLHTYLGNLQAGATKQIVRKHLSHARKDIVTYTPADEDWTRVVNIEIAQIESTIRIVTHEQDRVAKRIAAWTYCPNTMRIVDVEQVKHAAKAEREAKAAAKGTFRRATREDMVPGMTLYTSSKKQVKVVEIIKNRYFSDGLDRIVDEAHRQHVQSLVDDPRNDEIVLLYVETGRTTTQTIGYASLLVRTSKF